MCMRGCTTAPRQSSQRQPNSTRSPPDPSLLNNPSPPPPAHVPLFLYPFLNTVSKTRPFEYLRLTSLGVIGALVKVRAACAWQHAHGMGRAAAWMPRMP